jgi:hypothetical protein
VDALVLVLHVGREGTEGDDILSWAEDTVAFMSLRAWGGGPGGGVGLAESGLGSPRYYS